MEMTLVYSKTASGLVALKTGAEQLTAFEARVLALVDGTADTAALAAQVGAMDAASLPQVLAGLAQRNLIHAYHDAAEAARAGEHGPGVAAIEVVELSAQDSVQAWAEAQRGARELREKGFYSPAMPIHHAHRADGASQRRILVVEDDATTAQVIEFLLQEHAFDVTVAADSTAALAALAARPLPDAVLLDVMLPGKDGFAILRYIRSTPRLAQLPVIMVTAQVSDEHVMRGLKEGADGYVFKPFKWDTLYGCIKNVL